MSRQIKFRAWDVEYKKMLDMDDLLSKYDVYERDSPSFLDLIIDCQELKNQKYVLMQFTGLKDKNGKEVYEGDVLDFDPGEWGGLFISKVSWDSENAEWSFGGGLANDVSKWRQVIGNICQNPELLSNK